MLCSIVWKQTDAAVPVKSLCEHARMQHVLKTNRTYLTFKIILMSLVVDVINLCKTCKSINWCWSQYQIILFNFSCSWYNIDNLIIRRLLLHMCWLLSFVSVPYICHNSNVFQVSFSNIFKCSVCQKLMTADICAVWLDFSLFDSTYTSVFHGSVAYTEFHYCGLCFFVHFYISVIYK